MIFDHRVYTARPNMLPKFLALYEEVGLPMQLHYLGAPVGFYQTHIGDLSRAIHIWPYPSLAERELRRDRMEADPEWQAYRLKVIETDYLLDMRNQIVRAVSFFDPETGKIRTGGAA
ncbi:NIPSNAP family protein [Pseudooceanicola sp. GBMRC 2024]|uniref:NIPSNAP family protein n=1 Tax=Pseudooceanicola albus TaxID=2692189 RepID=A0A6L7G1S5_9RHOB|nr:NIPSNAP family protein [Pseudooceanicola albus]MXN17951.1 NIPSNAP family protein [Pseudooceanicola albus]